MIVQTKRFRVPSARYACQHGSLDVGSGNRARASSGLWQGGKKGEWHLQNHVDIVGKRVHKGQKGEAQEGDSNCVDRGGGRGILAPDPHGLTRPHGRQTRAGPPQAATRSCRFSNVFDALGSETQRQSETASIAASQRRKEEEITQQMSDPFSRLPNGGVDNENALTRDVVPAPAAKDVEWWDFTHAPCFKQTLQWSLGGGTLMGALEAVRGRKLAAPWIAATCGKPFALCPKMQLSRR